MQWSGIIVWSPSKYHVVRSLYGQYFRMHFEITLTWNLYKRAFSSLIFRQFHRDFKTGKLPGTVLNFGHRSLDQRWESSKISSSISIFEEIFKDISSQGAFLVLDIPILNRVHFEQLISKKRASLTSAVYPRGPPFHYPNLRAGSLKNSLLKGVLRKRRKPLFIVVL